MRNQCGAILFMAILFTGLLSLLVLSQMQLICLHIKALNHVIERHRILAELEQSAHQLLMLSRPACLRQTDDPNGVVDALKKKGGCLYSYQGRQYRYLFETSGVVPCLFTRVDGNEFSISLWRLTLATETQNPVFLQIRLAKAVPCVICEHHIKSTIKTGILSWRSLG